MTSTPDAGAELYVALGDSISIDVYAGGPGRGGASLLARNRDEDFPQWRGRDLASTRPELGFALLAADGEDAGHPEPSFAVGPDAGLPAGLRRQQVCAGVAEQDRRPQRAQARSAGRVG